MVSKKSHRAREDTSDMPRLLTKSEMASLKQDMQRSSAWLKEELDRRYPPKQAKSHKAKRDTSDVPRLLTRSEIASLRRDMKESSDWAKIEAAKG